MHKHLAHKCVYRRNTWEESIERGGTRQRYNGRKEWSQTARPRGAVQCGPRGAAQRSAGACNINTH